MMEETKLTTNGEGLELSLFHASLVGKHGVIDAGKRRAGVLEPALHLGNLVRMTLHSRNRLHFTFPTLLEQFLGECSCTSQPTRASSPAPGCIYGTKHLRVSA